MSIMLAVRNHALAFYKATETCAPICIRGQRFIVNKLTMQQFRRNDLVVYQHDGKQVLGVLAAVPGDTVSVGDGYGVLPKVCPLHHNANGVFMLADQSLVWRSDIVGTAYRLSISKPKK